MTDIAFAVLAAGMFFIGYFLRNIHDRFTRSIEMLKPQEVPHPPESKSALVEPLTPEQQARKDLAERVKKLNS